MQEECQNLNIRKLLKCNLQRRWTFYEHSWRIYKDELETQSGGLVPMAFQSIGSDRGQLTEIHGCLRASEAVMRLAGLMVNILLIRSFASGVTVSHSGDGN